MNRIAEVLGRSGLLLLLVMGMSSATAASGERIVIFGVTGRIGGVIAHEALSRGDTVVGVARSLSTLTIKSPHFTAVAGDVTNLDSFKRITRGADAVIIAVFGNGKDNSPENSVSARAAKIAVEAYTGLPHSPHVIQIGAGPTMYGTRKAMLAHLSLRPGSRMYGIFFGHLIALQTYRASHIRWTVLTPPMHIQGLTGSAGIGRGSKRNPPLNLHRTGKYRVSTTRFVRNARGDNVINVADLAVAAVDEAEHPRFIGRRFTVGY